MRTPEGVVLGHLPLRNKKNKKIVGIFYPLDSDEYLGALNYRVGRKIYLPCIMIILSIIQCHMKGGGLRYS